MTNKVLLCNQERVDELNNKIYQRNLTNASVEMHESFRSVPTRQVLFPILDCNKPVTVARLDKKFDINTMYTPSNYVPTQSYRDNIDIETKLRGTIFPIQKCDQAKFIPDSKSDLYNNNHIEPRRINNNTPHALLFKEQRFNNFNPNMCKLGHELFHNSTRVQLRDL